MAWRQGVAGRASLREDQQDERETGEGVVRLMQRKLFRNWRQKEKSGLELGKRA